MLNSWLVLAPPLVILAGVVTTKRLNLSLIMGLISGALIAAQGSVVGGLEILRSRLWIQLTDLDNLYLYAFLIILGTILSVLEYSGAATAFAHRLTSRLRSGKAAQTATLWLSSALFIDDYLSCLTAGYVMRPLMDKFNLPRVKLAYLIHSLSGPVVILAPLSSWIALITSQLENSGVSNASGIKTKILADPFYLYLQSIPYIFYSLFLIASVWYIVRRSISYGPMHTQERIAQKTGNLFGGKDPLHSKSLEPDQSGSVWDLAIPLLVLIGTFMIGILWVGGYSLFGGQYSLLEALQRNNQTSVILLVSSMITLAITWVLCACKGKCGAKNLYPLFRLGFDMMKSSIMMIFLASTMGLMLRADLQTGSYLAQALYGVLAVSLLPFLFYLISIVTALITGSAWGTIALMLPIAIQMTTALVSTDLPTTIETIPLLLPILGAIFSGAVCGNHISPIAETTIMSSSSAGCYPLDHANTQFWYALPAIVGAGVSFLAIGILPYSQTLNFCIALGIGVILCLGSITAFNRYYKHT